MVFLSEGEGEEEGYGNLVCLPFCFVYLRMECFFQICRRNLFVCLALFGKSKEMSSESDPRETKTDIRPTSRCDVQPNSVHSARGAAKKNANPEGNKISQKIKIFDLCFSPD